MARPMGPMTAQIENFLRAEARGEPHDKILTELFGPEYVTDPAKKSAAESKMSRWRKRPEAKAIWDDELSITVKRRIPDALSRLLKQIDNSNDWVANKASNDIMTLATRIGVIKNEETVVKVEVDGLPDLGSPEEDV